jgi:hypothetical protein
VAQDVQEEPELEHTMIVMLSAGRAGLIKSLDWCKPDCIAVKQCEIEAYRAAYPKITLLALPNEMNTAGKVRQCLIDFLKCNHVQVDDDLSYKTCDGNYPRDHINRIFKALDKYSLTGMGRRFMSQSMTKKPWEYEDKTCWEILGVNYADMKGQRFDEFPLENDKAMNIHAMLTRGTMVSYRGVTSNASIQTGGCPAYRTAAVMEETRRRIHARWPQYTELVKKPKVTKGAGIVDLYVQVKWRKLVDERKSNAR